MKLYQRLLGAIGAALLLAGQAFAAEQASIVTAGAGPMSMATFVSTYLNPALRAIQACNNGSSAPANGPSSAPMAYQEWCDTTTNPAVIKRYDGSQWVLIGSLNTSTHAYVPFLTGGSSGGVPYFSSTGVMASSAALAQNGIVVGGGAGAAPASITACTNDQIPFGRTSNSPLCRSVTGDVTFSSGVSALGNIPSGTPAPGSVLFTAIAAPSTPASGKASVYVDSTSKNVAVKNDAGTINHGVQTKTAVTSQWLRSIADDGSVGQTQPAFSDVSGTAAVNQGGTGQTTAAAARGSSGLNVDQFTGHGDSTYSILATDRTVGTNASFTASRTWTLPAANAVNAGQEIIIADFQGTVTGTNTLVISRAGSDTINGGTSVTISVGNGAYMLKSDGSSKWTAQALGATATTGVSSVGGVTGAVGVANGVDISGSNVQITAARRTAPSTSVVTTGSHSGGFAANTSGTYTTPSNVLWIEGWVTGGGGGGGAGNNASGATAGNASCWNTTGSACSTPVYQAGGGSAGAGGVTNAAAGGAGGTLSGSAACDQPYTGNGGDGGHVNTASVNSSGGRGGSSFLGGAGRSTSSGTGVTATANSGSGGAGGAQGATVAQSGGGGGSGATCYFRINAPAGTYTYAVGTGGAGNASPGTGGGAGGAGADGTITVIEHYGS